MTRELKVLILEDSLTDAELVQRLLIKQKMNCSFYVATNRETFLNGLKSFSPDVILSDNSLYQFDSTEALKITRQHYLYTPFILVTGTVSDEFAAAIIKAGADDYLLKDRMQRLPAAIETAMNKRRAEKELGDYKYALDQSSDITITDRNGIIIYANENFCRLSQYSADELIGKDHRIINSDHHPASFFRYLWATIQDGKIWQGEVRNKAKDGSYYWVDTTIVPFMDESGNPYQYLAIRKDISEKKKVEEELKKSNERFQFASRATSDIIWELNFETKQYLVHEGGQRLFGINKQLSWRIGVEGKYIIPEDRERIRESFNDARMDPQRQFWQNEYQVYSMENTVLYIINHAIFIRNNEGKAIRAIGAITDITEKKKLESRLLDQQKKEQLTITATALQAQEKERNAIGQELHDNVNQILVGTKLLLSIMRDNPAKTGELMTLSINHLQNAIDENRKLAHELVTPDLETENFTSQLTNLSHKMLKPSGLDTYMDMSDFDEQRLTHEQKLAIYRIAQEQCTNIIKYAKASQVTILLKTTKEHFEMTISDNGKGMEEHKKTEGIGIRNINARLSIFNGVSAIKTAPGEGFALTIEIPLLTA